MEFMVVQARIEWCTHEDLQRAIHIPFLIVAQLSIGSLKRRKVTDNHDYERKDAMRSSADVNAGERFFGSRDSSYDSSMRRNCSFE